MEKYHITAENIYNWDEKGFMIGQAQTTKRLMSQEALESGRTVQANQDGSREFISLLACVSATGVVITSTLIYKAASYDLQDTWVEDVKVDDDVIFSSSQNGWTTNSLGVQWLTKVFDTHMKARAVNRRRLLIVEVDG